MPSLPGRTLPLEPRNPDISRAQVGQNGQNAPVLFPAFAQLELAENAAHMALDSPLAQEQPIAYRLIGTPLRHQSEHLVLALGEVLQGILLAASSQQL